MSEMEKEQAKQQPQDPSSEVPDEPGYQPPQAPLEGTEGEGPSPAQLGIGARLIGTITSPTETFKDFRNKNGVTWLVPVFLLIITGGAAFYSFVLRVDTEILADAMRDATPRMFLNMMSSSMTADQINQQFMQQAQVTKALGGINVVVGMFLMVFISGLMLWLFGKLVNSKAKFWQVISVISFAVGVPTAIKFSLATVVNLMQDMNAMAFEGMRMNTLMSNPAAMLGVDRLGMKLYTILSIFDVFGFWALFLQVLAIAAVGNITKGKAAVPVLLAWFLGMTCTVVPNLL